jgi:hypothetical protein
MTIKHLHFLKEETFKQVYGLLMLSSIYHVAWLVTEDGPEGHLEDTTPLVENICLALHFVVLSFKVVLTALFARASLSYEEIAYAQFEIEKKS